MVYRFFVSLSIGPFLAVAGHGHKATITPLPLSLPASCTPSCFSTRPRVFLSASHIRRPFRSCHSLSIHVIRHSHFPRRGSQTCRLSSSSRHRRAHRIAFSPIQLQRQSLAFNSSSSPVNVRASAIITVLLAPRPPIYLTQTHMSASARRDRIVALR